MCVLYHCDKFTVAVAPVFLCVEIDCLCDCYRIVRDIAGAGVQVWGSTSWVQFQARKSKDFSPSYSIHSVSVVRLPPFQWVLQFFSGLEATIIPYHIVSYHTISYHIKPYHIKPYHIIECVPLLSLRQPQNPHRWFWERPRAFEVRSWRLTAWVRSRPCLHPW